MKEITLQMSALKREVAQARAADSEANKLETEKKLLHEQARFHLQSISNLELARDNALGEQHSLKVELAALKEIQSKTLESKHAAADLAAELQCKSKEVSDLQRGLEASQRELAQKQEGWCSEKESLAQAKATAVLECESVKVRRSYFEFRL